MPASGMSEDTAVTQRFPEDICHGSYLQVSRNRDDELEIS
jgi:hypothetical protein